MFSYTRYQKLAVFLTISLSFFDSSFISKSRFAEVWDLPFMETIVSLTSAVVLSYGIFLSVNHDILVQNAKLASFSTQ